jgi:chemotaxis protein methyltransferase CheR
MTVPIPRFPTAPSPANGILTALLEARAGQALTSDRSWRIETALKPLLRERGLDTLDQLVSRLLSDRDPGIGDRIVEALLNGETSFFRDPSVLDMAVEAVAGRSGRRARIWSAGCSTGQEPLSLAMLFAERAEETGAPVPEIVASDLSEAALTRAQAGLYSQFEIQRGLPIRRAMRWFEAQPSGDWLASPVLLRMISHRRLNLISEAWPLGTFDAILCRNVLLYLAPALKPAVFTRFAAALRPGGILLLGAGETVIGHTRLFAPSPTLRGAYVRSEEEVRG